ncbi:MAG: hypothetical protein J6I35_09180 [Ruminobacter sp.]|nr:hypothetical protein [Ruminobacter sp.]MBP3749695.1 hypothetical protein [Ruminobacter sp.]
MPIAPGEEIGYGLNIFHPEVEKAMDFAIKRINELWKPRWNHCPDA